MDSKVYLKVQFCTAFTDWIDIPKKFDEFSEAESYAIDISSCSKLFSSRVIRVYEIVVNEFIKDD